MQLGIFLTKELEAQLTETINIVHNFGNVDLVNPDTGEYDCSGDHCLIECTPEDFCKWVHSIKEEGIWMTEGIPQLEQFTFHFKKEFKLNG